MTPARWTSTLASTTHLHGVQKVGVGVIRNLQVQDGLFVPPPPLAAQHPQREGQGPRAVGAMLEVHLQRPGEERGVPIELLHRRHRPQVVVEGVATREFF